MTTEHYWQSSSFVLCRLTRSPPPSIGEGGGCVHVVNLTLFSAAHIPHPQSVAAQFAGVTTGPDAKGSVGERTSTVMSRPPPKTWHSRPPSPATGQVHQLFPPNGPASKPPKADPDPSMAGCHVTTPALKQTCEDSSNTQFTHHTSQLCS